MIPTETTELPDNSLLPVDTGGVTAPPEESPAHLARCAECAFSVQYRSSASGAGFTLIGSDAALGIGEHGRPICPNGHGELAIADDQLPAAEAITQVAEQLAPKQQPLFEPPAFNSDNALAEIFTKRHAVARLEREAENAAKESKRAKKALDDENVALGRMIERFEREVAARRGEIERRRERSEAGHPADTTLVRCTFEQQHPGEACPLCDGSVDGEIATAPRDSVVHAEQAERVLAQRAVDELIEELDEMAGIVVMDAQVHGWSPELRAEVEAWLQDATLNPDERERWMGARPRALSGLHVAGDRSDDEQLCRDCGAILLKFGDADVDDDPYPVGTLVGADCPGAAKPEPEHHYPEKKKRGRKKAEASAADAPPADAPQSAAAESDL